MELIENDDIRISSIVFKLKYCNSCKKNTIQTTQTQIQLNLKKNQSFCKTKTINATIMHTQLCENLQFEKF